MSCHKQEEGPRATSKNNHAYFDFTHCSKSGPSGVQRSETNTVHNIGLTTLFLGKVDLIVFVDESRSRQIAQSGKVRTLMEGSIRVSLE